MIAISFQARVRGVVMQGAQQIHDTIVQQAYHVFRADVATTPTITLRGGNDLDGYRFPTPYDPVMDVLTDAYIEKYAPDAVFFLDAASWRHYIPPLIAYTFRHLRDRGFKSTAPDSFLATLRPPDREPPQLRSLTPAQEAVIVAFLEALAFDDDTHTHEDDALLILEEWWLPNARYRPS